MYVYNRTAGSQLHLPRTALQLSSQSMQWGTMSMMHALGEALIRDTWRNKPLQQAQHWPCVQSSCMQQPLQQPCIYIGTDLNFVVFSFLSLLQVPVGLQQLIRPGSSLGGCWSCMTASEGEANPGTQSRQTLDSGPEADLMALLQVPLGLQQLR